MGIYPEIKSPAWHREQGQDLSRIVLKVLERYGYRTKADKVFLQCFDYQEVKRLRNELGYQGRLIQLLAGSEVEPAGNRFCVPDQPRPVWRNSHRLPTASDRRWRR